ncbi:MAG: Crp/Fnr family transcriptional regulator [Pseudomonadota bacterium]
MTQTPEELQDIVRQGSLLADVPRASLETLISEGRDRALTKGQILFQKGDPGDFVAVVLSGCLKVSAYSPSGHETVLNLLRQGDVAGELAVIDGAERSADASALEATELLILSRGSFNRLLESDVEFAAGVARALCTKLRTTSDALEATTLDMSRRVATSLLRLAGQHSEEDDGGDLSCEIAIDQGTLARYCGLTRSNLNRVLKRFETAGASRHEKGVLHILDTDWLEDYALSED